MRTIIVYLLLAAVASAQTVVVLSEDGKQAWYAPDEQSTATLVDRVVTLSGDEPIDPNDPPPPTEDKWGLVALSEEEARKVTGDPNRNKTAVDLGVAHIAIGQEVKEKRIPGNSTTIRKILDVAFALQAGTAAKPWTPWKNNTRANYTTHDLRYETGDAGQGIMDIGHGAVNSSTAAIGDGELLKRILDFIERILPMLLILIDLFSPSEIAEMIHSGMTLDDVREVVLQALEERGQ